MSDQLDSTLQPALHTREITRVLKVILEPMYNITPPYSNYNMISSYKWIVTSQKSKHLFKFYDVKRYQLAVTSTSIPMYNHQLDTLEVSVMENSLQKKKI